MNELQVVLIGGTSHAGKSTLAQSLGRTLGWECISTDSLARHPGRPWKALQKPVPSHVVEHYSSLSAEALLADVLQHYQRMWPGIEDMVRRHASVSSKDGLILEGSALWPVSVASLTVENVRAVWLTASDEFLCQRIYSESQFDEATDQEKKLIQKFIDRTLLYNQRMIEEVRRLGLISINVEEVASLDNLSDRCLVSLQ